MISSIAGQVTRAYAYDACTPARELTMRRQAVGELLRSYAYTLGPAGNRTQIDEHDGTSRTYGHDDLYRGGAGPVYQKALPMTLWETGMPTAT